jgi:ferritin-like metal-binding protein YciE
MAVDAVKGNSSTSVKEVLLDQLQCLYRSKDILATELKKMKEAADRNDIRDFFSYYEERFAVNIQRLDEIRHLAKLEITSAPCGLFNGIIQQTESLFTRTNEKSFARDAALIMAGQQLMHFMIATFGNLGRLADSTGLTQVATLLNDSLYEEHASYVMLDDIAEKLLGRPDLNI